MNQVRGDAGEAHQEALFAALGNIGEERRLEREGIAHGHLARRGENVDGIGEGARGEAPVDDAGEAHVAVAEDGQKHQECGAEDRGRDVHAVALEEPGQARLFALCLTRLRHLRQGLVPEGTRARTLPYFSKKPYWLNTCMQRKDL